MNQQSNDPKVFVTAKFGQDKKGGETVFLTIKQEEIGTLIQALTELSENPRGVKLRAHIYEKQSNYGGTFLSGTMFISPVNDPPADVAAPARFVPRATSGTAPRPQATSKAAPQRKY